MQTLFLDLASHPSAGSGQATGSIACVTDEKVHAFEGADHRIGDAELVPLIEKVLKDAEWDYKDLTNIVCVVGPGGFTSLRVGVACANALMWSLNIPGTGIHLSDLYLARSERLAVSGERLELAATRYSLPASVWLHSTKKHELFIREFGNERSLYSNPTLVTLSELQNFLQPDMQWMGELIPEHREIVDAKELKEATLMPLQDILPGFLGNLEYSQKQLEPWYGRGR